MPEQVPFSITTPQPCWFNVNRIRVISAKSVVYRFDILETVLNSKNTTNGNTDETDLTDIDR